MLTVPEAARRAGRDPETIRRWIRGGRLRARKVGTQHVIEERDLVAALDEGDEQLAVPERWRLSDTGRPLPNLVAAIRRSRRDR
jgi:excisionase family DNA binding protein